MSYYDTVRNKISKLEKIELKRELTDDESDDLECLYLQDEWFLCAEKLRRLFGEQVVENLIEDVRVTYSDNLAVSKGALGLTRKNSDGKSLTVGFSWLVDEIIDINEQRFYEVLLHEMCHCAAFFTDGTLDHGEVWQKFVDKLNKSYGYEIKERYEDDDIKIFDDEEEKEEKRS